MRNLKERQRKVLEMLQHLDILSDFYLAGGTALLIKYDHRPSEDFDFFLFPEREFRVDIYERTLLRAFPAGFKIVYKDRETLIFTLNEVKISLFQYPYPLLEKPEINNGIFIAGDKDIACMKALAINGRGLKKDFFDLWMLIQIHGWKLKDMVDMIKEKYETYNTLLFVKALVYFEDAEKNQDLEVIEEKWDEIKSFFVNYVRDYVDSELI